MSEAENANPDQKALALAVEVSGCACTCNHCANQGHPYPSMKLGDIERILEQVARFCQSEGMRFCPYPMHDFLMHKHPLKIVELFQVYGGAVWKPVATTPGPPLGLRADWEEILSGLKELGTTMLWFVFHGLDEIHNRAENRKNAFTESIKAIERGKSVGLECAADVYLSTDNTHQVPQLAEFCHSVGLDWFSFDVAGFMPHPRLRKYESIRPELSHLMPYIDLIAGESKHSKEKWENLNAYTEAHYISRAMGKGSEEDRWYGQFEPNALELVCRNNMDLHTGHAGLYGPFHGNLGCDDERSVFENALKTGAWSLEKVFFPEAQIPSVPELAERYGDAQSQRVHLNDWTMRLLWLDRAFGREGE